MQPTNLDVFHEDEETQEIADRNRVGLIDNTGDRLTRGNGSIGNLNPNKYYMMAVYSNDDFLGYDFIMANGSRSKELRLIQQAKSTVIPNLNNDLTYAVSAASPIANNGIQLTYFDTGASGNVPVSVPTTKATIYNGAITITPPSSGFNRYYLNIAPFINASNNYEIMMIPITPSDNKNAWGNWSRVSAYNSHGGSFGAVNKFPFANYEPDTPPDPNKVAGIFQFRSDNTVPAYLTDMSLIELWGQNTVADYVIIERNSLKEIISFNVIRVTIGNPEKTPEPLPPLDPPPEQSPDNLTIILDLSFSIESLDYPTMISIPAPISYSQSAIGVIITATVNNASGFTDIRWYFDGQEIGQGAVLSLNIDALVSENLYFFTVGTHELTVEATSDGKPYSRSFIINVMP